MYENIYCLLKKKKQQIAKETTEQKRISVENLTGYDDIVYEFTMRTFNLRDRVVSLYWLLISEAATKGAPQKKLFLNISQYWQENTSAEVSF